MKTLFRCFLLYIIWILCYFNHLSPVYPAGLSLTLKSYPPCHPKQESPQAKIPYSHSFLLILVLEGRVFPLLMKSCLLPWRLITLSKVTVNWQLTGKSSDNKWTDFEGNPRTWQEKRQKGQWHTEGKHGLDYPAFPLTPVTPKCWYEKVLPVWKPEGATKCSGPTLWWNEDSLHVAHPASSCSVVPGCVQS